MEFSYKIKEDCAIIVSHGEKKMAKNKRQYLDKEKKRQVRNIKRKRRKLANKRQKKSPVAKAVFSLILTLAIGVFLVSGLKLLSIFTTYKKAENTYGNIQVDVADIIPDVGYPKVDFEKLLAQNPDTVGYIFSEDVMAYPIVQGTDNEYYLHTMFNGEWNPSGTLFVDSRLPDGMESKNCIIYGHNMKDESMFGKLYKYSDPEYYNAHRIYHVYTPEHHYVYKAIAAYTAAVDGFTYTMGFGSDEAFLDFIEQTKYASWFDSDTEVSADSKIITLSTCLGNNDDDYRNVLILVRESEITEESETAKESEIVK